MDYEPNDVAVSSYWKDDCAPCVILNVACRPSCPFRKIFSLDDKKSVGKFEVLRKRYGLHYLRVALLPLEDDEKRRFVDTLVKETNARVSNPKLGVTNSYWSLKTDLENEKALRKQLNDVPVSDPKLGVTNSYWSLKTDLENEKALRKQLNDVPVSTKRKADFDEDPNDGLNKQRKADYDEDSEDLNDGNGVNIKKKFDDYPPLAISAPSDCKIVEVKITNGQKVEEGQVLLVYEHKVTPEFSYMRTISEQAIARVKRNMEEKCRCGVYSVEDVAVGKNAAKKTSISSGYFKKFDVVKDHSDHLFAAMNSPMNQLSKEWENKMKEEWRILEKDLPKTMFVRVYESRIDLLRVAIIGPKGTPYHDGLFFFDVYFPSTYPDSPPVVRYHSGGVSIHPYVFKCGEVRLSCFEPVMWQAGSWNVVQLLVSIKNLVLTKRPYFIQRELARMEGSLDGEKLCSMYNENTLIKSLKTMVYTMNKPPKNFEDLVVGYFGKRVTRILKACEAYTEGVQVGSKNDKGFCSIQFRNDVAKRVKPLVTAFKRIGAKKTKKFSYLSEKRTPFPPLAPASNPPEDFSEWQKCNYTALMAYRVIKVLVEEGMEVKEGDPFFTIKTVERELLEEWEREMAIREAEFDAKLAEWSQDSDSDSVSVLEDLLKTRTRGSV